MKKVRFAGYFYEGEKEKLKEQIKKCFESSFGPPKYFKIDDVVCGMVPHAGYSFSGPCCAWFYKLLKDKKFENVVIFGLSHRGYKGCCVSLEDYETPLGVVKNNNKVGLELIRRGFVDEIDEVHDEEHSVEVQLPFLQTVLKDFKIIPIIVGKLNKELVEYLSKLKNTLFVGSSDFTHYGMAYGYLPFEENAKENMYKLDKEAIDIILSLNIPKFIDFSSDKTICGVWPIINIMYLAKILGLKGRLLKYYTSGDVMNDYSNSVGYGSLVFLERKV